MPVRHPRPDDGAHHLPSAPHRLLTIRYDTPQSFKIFRALCDKQQIQVVSATDVLVAIWNTMVDRLADIIERIGADLDALSCEIFRHSQIRSGRDHARRRPRPLEEVIGDIGRSQDVTFRIRESLQTFERVVVFARAHLRSETAAADLEARSTTSSRCTTIRSTCSPRCSSCWMRRSG